MLKIWNVRTGRELSTLQDSDPLDVFSRTDLSAKQRREIAMNVVKEYVSPTGVLAVTFTQDNRHVVAFHKDRLVRQWDIRTRMPTILREDATCDQILLIPESDRAVACLSNGLYVWDLKSGHDNLLAHYPTGILPNAMQVDRRGRYVIFCLADRRMVLWDLRTCRELAHVPFDHSPQCVSIAPGDDAVFVADTIGNVYRLAVEGLV
jgi:WD40 repeat protein